MNNPKTKGQKRANGVPTRNHRPPFLNLIKPTTTSTAQSDASHALAVTAASKFTVRTSRGPPNAQTATTRDATNSGLKFFIVMARLCALAETVKPVFGTSVSSSFPRRWLLHRVAPSASPMPLDPYCLKVGTPARVSKVQILLPSPYHLFVSTCSPL
jgi:hypothetical protein